MTISKFTITWHLQVCVVQNMSSGPRINYLHLGANSILRGIQFGTPGKKPPRYPLHKRLGGPQNIFGLCVEKKNPAPTGTGTPNPLPSNP
jgi:hypothetical protein